MSQETRCSFCEKLPASPPKRRARPGKCPLCKQAIWWDMEGAAYRHADGEPCCPAATVWMALGLAGVLACVTFGITRWRGGDVPKASEPVVANSHAPVLAVVAEEPVRETRPVLPPHVVTKRPIPSHLARVKPPGRVPGPAPARSARADVKPVPEVDFTMPPRAKSTGAGMYGSPWTASGATVVVDSWKWAYDGELLLVPQVDLDPDFHKKNKRQIAEQAKDIATLGKDDRSAFPRKLMAERADLAGLPFALGDACSLPKDETLALAQTSRAVRTQLSRAENLRGRYPGSPGSPYGATYPVPGQAFWSSHSRVQPAAIPALRQILMPQDKAFRLGLVDHLKDVEGTPATLALVNRALFDMDADVRYAAVEVLKGRPADDFRKELVQAFRYPWTPVAYHSAVAVARLDMRELIPQLIDMLELPAPEAPYAVASKAGKKYMVREVVRINHHRNCLLCHPPAGELEPRTIRQLPLGPVPCAEDELPPSSTVYYAVRRGITAVRADVTYLRQDFSIMQEVASPGHWPKMQRFDFLVRVRAATDTDLRGRAPSGYKHAVASALRSLTGLDAPAEAGKWRELLPRIQAHGESKSRGGALPPRGPAK